jgi:hypothetical protein
MLHAISKAEIRMKHEDFKDHKEKRFRESHELVSLWSREFFSAA